MKNKISDRAKQSIEPKLRFPRFRDNGSWVMKPLGTLCEILNNRRKPISSNNREKGKYPYYGASGVVDYVDNYIFDEKLVLVGEDGAKWSAFDKTAFIAEGKYWVNNHAHVLRPIKIEETFLENYLVMIDIGPFITGAAPPKLTLGKLKEIPISFPQSNMEQQKIADCLTTIDDLITAQSQKLHALKAQKKGLMQKLFPVEGGAVPLFRFPEFKGFLPWRIAVLGDYCKITTGKLDANAMIHGGKYRFYTCAKDYYFIDNYAFDTDALLISGNGANVGYIHHYKGKFNAYQRTYVLDQFTQHIYFIKYFLDKHLHGRISKEKKEGNTPYIVMSTIEDMKIVLPPIKAEQKKIADCLVSIDSLIRAQSQKLDALKIHKKGLMQQLFPSLSEISE